MKQRLLWIDALRGILILTVILGHALQHGDYYHRLPWNIIYSFHMAAFFAVSGYANCWSKINGNTLRRRAEQLLVPFFAWTVLVALRSEDVFGTFTGEILHPAMYWFIFALFFIIAIFFLLDWMYKMLKTKQFICEIIGWLLLIAIMLLLNPRFLGFQYIAYYFAFYALGYYVNKFEIKPKLWITLLIGACWLFLALFWRMQEVSPLLSGISFLPASILTFGYRFVTATLGSLFLLFISPILFADNNSCVNKCFAYLGRESLGIYIIHIFIATYWSTYLAKLLTTDTSLLFILLDFTGKLVVSIVGLELIKRIPYMRYLLLGIKQK